jgi:hypothetical protein
MAATTAATRASAEVTTPASAELDRYRGLAGERFGGPLIVIPFADCKGRGHSSQSQTG